MFSYHDSDVNNVILGLTKPAFGPDPQWSHLSFTVAKRYCDKYDYFGMIIMLNTDFAFCGEFLYLLYFYSIYDDSYYLSDKTLK